MSSIEGDSIKNVSEQSVEAARCPKNFQVWIAFIFGLVCMVVAVGLFDRFSRSQQQAGSATSLQNAGTSAKTVAGRPGTTLWLGIDAKDVDAPLAAQLGLEEAKGVWVTRVYSGSPAEEAEIERGDVIISFARQKVKVLDDLRTILTSVDAGDHVRACLYRNEVRVSVYVAPSERPAGATSLIAGEDGSGIDWGMTVSETTAQLRAAFGIPNEQAGVVVVGLIANSLAEAAQVLRGDLIRSVNHRKTEDIESFVKVLSDADEGLLLDVYRRGEQLFISVGSPKMPAPPIPANTGIRSVAGTPVAAQYVAGTTGTAASSDVEVCICPVCKTTVAHPLGVPCSQLSCPVCGARMVKATL